MKIWVDGFEVPPEAVIFSGLNFHTVSFDEAKFSPELQHHMKEKRAKAKQAGAIPEFSNLFEYEVNWGNNS